MSAFNDKILDSDDGLEAEEYREMLMEDDPDGLEAHERKKRYELHNGGRTNNIVQAAGFGEVTASKVRKELASEGGIEKCLKAIREGLEGDNHLYENSGVILKTIIEAKICITGYGIEKLIDDYFMDHWGDMDTGLCFFDDVVDNSCLLSNESRNDLLDSLSENMEWCKREGILEKLDAALEARKNTASDAVNQLDNVLSVPENDNNTSVGSTEKNETSG